MTATNGASLEDCLTNIFSLIDLNGIRWKRFKLKENNNYLYTPIDTHPILTTYAKCIEENHIAVWRQEPQKRHSATGAGGGNVGQGGGNSAGGGGNVGQGGGNTAGGGGGSASHSNFPTPTRTSNNNTPTNTGPGNGLTTTSSGNQNNNNNNGSSNVQNNYELWIFGYGNQLKVDDVIGDDLVEIEDDTWDQKGLSYECRTLLFKALHNLIDRCLINKGFTRIGRWFVRPHTENLSHSACCHNTIATTLNNNTKPFKHLKTEHSSITSPQPPSSNVKGTTKSLNLSSTVSTTINDIIESRRRIYDSQQCLDKHDGLRHTSTRSSSSYFTSSLDGTKSSLSFAFSFFVHGDSTICATVDVRQHPLVHPLTRADLTAFQEGGIVRVALAPYGLNGILNGVSYKDSDNGAATTTFIQQWSKFYPLPKTLTRLIPSNKSSNSAMTNLNQKTQANEGQNSRSYLSNLTNMLLPPSNKPTLHFNYEPNELPPVVEVIVAGHRMRYPSECVFTTTKVIDLYKSLNQLTPNQKPLTSSKRMIRGSPNKPNKLSLLSEKLCEEKNDLQTKVKIEPDQTKAQTNFDSPFTLTSTPFSEGSNKSAPKSDGSLTVNFTMAQPPGGTEVLKDKIMNGCIDPDINRNTFNSSGTQTISRYNSSKVGFSSNNIPLGPTDLVKLFPTPPSLEQIVVSPSTTTDESGAMKEPTTLSPANANQNVNELAKDNGIDVYKPVECALMPPPPKWAALTNIIISSSKSLPPQCIYKGSSRKNETKDIVRRFCESTKGDVSTIKNSSSHKQLNSLIDKSKNSPASLSPLADQTNKNGFNLNPPTPKNMTTTSLLNTPNTTTFSPSQPNSSTTLTTPPTTAISSTLSFYTLPHQRLFNNLNEINSIQLNLLIADSVLGTYQDHNFESCSLCVCNMSIKGTQSDTILQRSDLTSQWRHSVSNDTINNPSNFGNESTGECTCGFSATTNRHYSHLSGLFLEDELEITNILYDPTEMIDQNKLFQKLRLSTYSESCSEEQNKSTARMFPDSSLKVVGKSLDDMSKPNIISKQDKSSKEDKSSHSTGQNSFEETKIFAIDQMKQQCSTMIHSNSSLAKVLMIESFRNNRHLTNCTNYYAQASNKMGAGNPFYRFLDDSNKFTIVKMVNRNPCSLKFSDFCELAKSIIVKLGHQSQQQNSRISGNIVKPIGANCPTPSSSLSSVFARMFSPRQTLLVGKSIDPHASNRNSVFVQGLQALVLPTLNIDPKGALQMLEQLVMDESKEALATLNKAILIFSSPLHDWQYITAPMPEKNFDVATLLKLIQPSIEEAIGHHNKLYKDFVHQQQQHIFSSRDSPTGAPTQPTPPCQGPLTWRQFHQAAGRGTEDQCEPQPIPSLLVGHHVEKNHLALSPFALKFWDKLLLEPYAPGHNMFYLVVAPDNQNILNYVNTFFKELSNTYEIMKLGKHVPIGQNGLILANFSSENNVNEEDSWFSSLPCDEKDPSGIIVNKLKSYASKLNSHLAKTIVEFMDERQPPYDPHADRFDSSPNPHATSNKPPNPLTNRLNHQQATNRPFNNLLGLNVPGTTQPQPGEQGFGFTPDNATPFESASQSRSLINSAAHGHNEDNIYLEDEAHKQIGIVIYMIDPFTSPSISQNLRTLAIIGLFKCYSMILQKLPENLQRITQLQLISLDSVISHSRPILNLSRVDQLKSLSMNVYSRCRKILTNQITAKSLTGFGPAAALEAFFKTKNPELCVSKMFTPPFILAPMKDKQTELGEMFGDRREKSSVLFCSYCITEDQRWLLASVTNDKGEMSESTVININIVDRMKRPKTSVRRVALRKLMEFIISVMSDWTNPWRLIIGKLGRLGHGELKEWATLMSKRSLLNYSRHLTERCRQCTILPPTETVSILSACLVSLEPDSKLRIMPDQFTSDDRQASFNKCPLSTPEDASATHILVFPTSASIQPTHGNVEDPLAGSGLDDDLLNQFPLEDGIEDLGVEENMDDLFSAWDDNPTNVSDHINPHHDTMMSSSNLQMGSVSGGDNAGNQDETLQLLQQPLALGYYISTASMGQMPNWFWSTSPHLRNSCPVFLKSALHIHMPCVQLSDDLLHSGVGQSRKSHQLDSNLTTDVLRYVLEGYNSLSWLALNPKTYDRQSCLPVHMQNLLQLYHLMESFS